MSSQLSYATFISQGVQRATGTLPNGEPIFSSPITSTLISGTEDALLVDPPFTLEQTARVGDWIAKSGKRLRYIYATHGHGDHWFGSVQLAQRFPGVTVLATPGTIAVMKLNATVGREKIFDRDFPNLIGETPVLAQPIPETGVTLDGVPLLPVELGHTDTDESTVLHVPSSGLVVAGDVVYNGVHSYLAETGKDGLDRWLAALDQLKALRADVVIAGHKNHALADDPRTIDETRRYLLER